MVVEVGPEPSLAEMAAHEQEPVLLVLEEGVVVLLLLGLEGEPKPLVVKLHDLVLASCLFFC